LSGGILSENLEVREVKRSIDLEPSLTYRENVMPGCQVFEESDFVIYSDNSIVESLKG